MKHSKNVVEALADRYERQGYIDINKNDAQDTGQSHEFDIILAALRLYAQRESA